MPLEGLHCDAYKALAFFASDIKGPPAVMTITLRPAPGINYAFADFLNFLDALLFYGEIVSGNAGGFTALVDTSAGYIQTKVAGSGLSYQNVGGSVLPASGVLKSAVVSIGQQTLGTFTTLDLSASAITNALKAELYSGDRSAIERLLMAQQWDYAGTSANDYAPNGFRIGDGVLFNPRGNDIFRLAGGNDNVFSGDGFDRMFGGVGNDTLDGGIGNDSLYGEGQRDLLVGGAGNDLLDGGIDNDRLFGDAGSDRLFGSEGDDTIDGGVGQDLAAGGPGDDLILGGTGNDTLQGNVGYDTLNGGAGADQMIGGAGNDTYVIDNAGDKVVEAAGQGSDSVSASVHFTLAPEQHVEVLATTSQRGTGAINLTGNELAQRVSGNNGANVLNGGGGNDRIEGFGGNDRLFGGAGNDTIVGGTGRDILSGSTGADVFVYSSVGDSTPTRASRDTIIDFTGIDDVDLRAIDANTRVAGDQAFRWIGSTAFSGGPELRFEKVASDTYVYGDVNGDRRADFMLHFDDPLSLNGTHFLL